MAKGDEYLIEMMDKNGRWFIVGSDRLNHIAQSYMRQYAHEHPRDAFRVIAYPSRVIQVLHDPIADRALSPSS